jgi:aminopeptidase YwaD
MEFLAGDALQGRASGSRDEWIAASYLGAQMQQWGLEPLGDAGGFVQQIEIERLETSAAPVLSVGAVRFTHGKEMRVQTVGSTGVSGPLQKYSADVRVEAGAVVLLAPATAPSAPGRPSPAALAATAGAAALLSLEKSSAIPSQSGRLPAPPPRLVGVAGVGSDRPTSVVLIKEAYDSIAALPEGTIVAIDVETKPLARTQTWNAVGRLPGSDAASAGEVILLSAHLDHVGLRPGAGSAPAADVIYNGADDDASGTVAVLELARALAAGTRPRRTIVFAFFGSEETGGFGSRYFVDRPVIPLPQLVANLQFEMIGRPDGAVAPRTLWLTGYERSTLGSALAAQGARLVQDPHPEQSFFTRSDNIRFARRGVVAHTVSSYGLHKDYHRPSDEVQLIDFPHMLDAIRSMLEPIRWLANSGFRPSWHPGMQP